VEIHKEILKIKERNAVLEKWPDELIKLELRKGKLAQDIKLMEPGYVEIMGNIKDLDMTSEAMKADLRTAKKELREAQSIKD